MTRPIYVSACFAVFLAGCQTAGDAQSVDDPAANALVGGIAESVGRCWFDENEPAFANYRYSAENVGGAGRVLIVPKENPGGRPVLVIQPRSADAVEVYGPLAGSELGSRISADIERWQAGGTACGT